MASLANSPLIADPRVSRRLMRSAVSDGQSGFTLMYELCRSAFLVLFAVVFPAMYFLHGIRRGRFTLAYLMLAPLIAAAALMTWSHLLSPVRLSSEDINQRESVGLDRMFWMLRFGIRGLLLASDRAAKVAGVGDSCIVLDRAPISDGFSSQY